MGMAKRPLLGSARPALGQLPTVQRRAAPTRSSSQPQPRTAAAATAMRAYARQGAATAGGRQGKSNLRSSGLHSCGGWSSGGGGGGWRAGPQPDPLLSRPACLFHNGNRKLLQAPGARLNAYDLPSPGP